MEAQNAVFQKLKPPCVALSQAALALNGPRADKDLIVSRLETLKYTLSSAISPPSTLDPKLAEYAFFPISQVLKASQKVPLRSLELCLQCVAILIDRGWGQKIPPQLAAQIVILCTMLADKKPKGLIVNESTDELRTSAFWCLHHLFSVVQPKSETAMLLTSTANMPQLGQTLSLILEGVYDGGSTEIQVSAMHALEGLVSNVLDREFQANFLPGIVSKLTRILTPETKRRRNHTVLIGCLGILGTLLQNTLNDIHSIEVHVDATQEAEAKSATNSQWQEQAAGQLKPALSSIMRLKSHLRTDVQEALGRLCSVLLQSCRKVLANCSHMALETLVTMSAAKMDRNRITELEMLVATDSYIAGLLQTILFEWLQSLATTMQGPDEQAKLSRMNQIYTSYDLLVKGGINTTTIDHILAPTLRDCVVITLTVPGIKQRDETLTQAIQSLDLDVLSLKQNSTVFKSPLAKYRGQEETLLSVERFTQLISSSSTSSAFAMDLARSLRQSHGISQLASFWLLLTSSQTALEGSRGGIDDLMEIDGTDRSYQEYLEELYSLSLSLLSDSTDEPPDPQLQAIALRTLAARAQNAGKDFRYELVDALYPVLHTLATPDEALQQDSITTLNVFTQTCGYPSVRDLIVDNVDYLTNAVALQLNSFVVSPQAPQVLLMMVRLAGPTLLPYLEDSVESIFAALEDYHGYPLLVELLFKLLGVIAEEGVKAPLLAITNSGSNDVFEERWQPTTVPGLAALLKENAAEELELIATTSQSHELHPQRPWKRIDDAEDGEAEERSEDSLEQQVDDSEPPPPAPKTYNLLFKIAELTQHFLPSASPSLRTSLLSLIRTTVPVIARHENSFLPLVNTLWPEVVSRLDDSERYVAATALDIVSVLCEYAGDFMRTRITQIWPRLVEMQHMILKSGAQSTVLPISALEKAGQRQPPGANKKSTDQTLAQTQIASTDHYRDTSSTLLWTALIDCLTAIVRFVHIQPDMFDDALDMVGSAIEQEGVLSVFVKENSDAVWLTRLRNGVLAIPRATQMADAVQFGFAEVYG